MNSILSEGTTFGIISGCMTAIGLILSNTAAGTSIKLIVMILISLAVSDGLSDAFGIYYSTYRDENDLTVALKEGSKAFLGKLLIPLVMALIFVISKNIKYANYIILVLVFSLFIFIDFFIFKNELIYIRVGNIVIFILIILFNYYLGTKFNK